MILTSTPKRIELKEVFRPSDLTYLQSCLINSSFCFQKPYPSRHINSLYFDNSDFCALEDSLEGSSIRKKTRLRWYGKENSECNATLEIKNKKGHLSWKKLIQDHYKVMPSSPSWETFFFPQSVTDKVTSYYLNPLNPVSIVSYERNYYASFDGRVRITFDHNLKTFDQKFLKGPCFRFERKHSRMLVVEIKVNQEDHHLLDDVFKTIPFSGKRFSKYCESLIPQEYC